MGYRGPDRESSARALLDYLTRADYRPVAQRELLHRMHVGPDERPLVRRLIRRLIRDGQVIKGRGGRLVAASRGGLVHGRFLRQTDALGLVSPDDDGQPILVSARDRAGAANGDRVAVRITGSREDGGLRGVIVKVLGPSHTELLGLFVRRGRVTEVQPFDPAVRDAIHVPASFRMGASHLHAVRVELTRCASAGRPAQGKILEVLGHLDEPGTDVLIVARKYGLPERFPDDVLGAADALDEASLRIEFERRERFDRPAPVTIDGETARDFDDAVAVEKLRGGFRLYVHIADVSHFVKPGGILDDEARRRGTSVYFPDRVVPMFPERLSNDLCSLRPGRDRLVQSVIIDFSGAGEPRQVRFSDGVIRSAARLTYTQVSAALDAPGGEHGIARDLVSMLGNADKLRQLLEKRRHERGSVDFDLPEPQILLDVEGAMTGITVEPRNRAHLLIEEFMLATNEAVARRLEEADRGCLYRVHEVPAPDKLHELSRFVSGFGLRLKVDQDPVEPRRIQELLEQVEGQPEARVVGQVALRSMKQARYSPDNIGHFGLASPTYCHFTSPIRRYPDLVVHRQLRHLCRGSERSEESGHGWLSSVAETSSALERNAESAERELLVWKKIAFIEGRVGEVFEGVVTGVARFGLFVQLVENLVEGLIRVELLGDEWFTFDEARLALVGARSGTTFRLGDRFHVRVEKVDRVLQRVDLAPQGASASGGDASRAERPRPQRSGTQRRRARPPRRRR